jgi:uncharacterized protein
MTQHINPLVINVGFIVSADAGFSRSFELDMEEVFLPPDLQLNDLRGSAQFSRTPQALLAEVIVSAKTPMQCARCADPIEHAAATKFTELYSFDKQTESDTELRLPSNHQIDLAPLVREYMFLDLPINPLCRPHCAGLCPVCGINRNDDSCEHDTSSIDPRLSTLKDLLDPKD